jgi:DNA-directed RNA polymerase subunit RPC12/RpoP
MTCPKGHEAIIERGDGADRHISCPWCGWRLTVKVHKNYRERQNIKRRKASQRVRIRQDVREKVAEAKRLLSQGVCFGHVCIKLGLPASTLNRYMRMEEG